MKKQYNYNATIDNYKSTDCGRFGKALEVNVKHLLNGNRGNSDKVSAKGKIDVKHKGLKYEIKSNCGEINENILTNDFIIYSYDSESDWNNPTACHVIPAKEFIEIVESLGLMRKKVSTNGQLKKSIQSYRNSKRKALAWMTAIDNYPTLGELIG